MNSFSTYRRIINYAKPHSTYIPQYILTSFLSIMFGLVNLTLLKPLLDVIFNQEDALERHPAQMPVFQLDLNYLFDIFYYYLQYYTEIFGKFGSLLFVCTIIVISVFISNAFRYISALILASVRVKVIRKIRQDIYYRVTQLHLGYFTDQRKGDIISRITNDVQEIENSITQSLKVIFREPFIIVIYFGVLFYLSFQLTLFTLLLLPISGLLISGISKRLKKKAVENQESLGRILNILDETLSGMRIIKAFNGVSYINNIFHGEVKQYERLNMSMSKRFELASPVSEFLGVSAVAGILLYGGNLVLSKQIMEPSTFLTYLVIFTQILNPVKFINQAIASVQRGIAAGDRIFAIVDTLPEIKDKEGAYKLEQFNHSITFRDVTFRYDKEPVLKNINFTIEKGKTLALVGPSGGGKSTIADLIPRFYDPDSGAILLDDKPLDNYKIESVRAHMGIVTQESILFNDTIFNNIAFGKSDVLATEVEKAAKIANAHDFIMQTEEGYQTVVGERGTRLSGGQRQRISIARAVLSNPDILILDEATSALDSESEMLVQEAIFNLMKNRTSIVIAHRLSTIQSADEILVIKDGEIVERGDHNTLQAQNGLYRKLISMQSF
ncbi:MAG: ABC transporter ATP-binding protein [Cyclobacteriaceae bacterium]|nr:ABC transporter ATP-binding protein [Cyclobacteriaceae bacterium]